MRETPKGASVRWIRQFNWLRVVLVIFDGVLVSVCLLLALWLRFEGGIPEEYWSLYVHAAPWMALIFVTTAFSFGLYNRIWAYASLDAAMTVLGTVTIASVVVLLVRDLLGDPFFPRSVTAGWWGFSLVAVGGSRFGWRAVRTRVPRDASRHALRRRALVYGAGHDGNMLARQAQSSPDAELDVVGYIDDDRSLRGMVLSGVRVLGTPAELETVVKRHKVEEIVVAVGCVPGGSLYDLYQRARALGVRVRTLPGLLELVNGQVSLPQVRDIDVADVLGRSSTCPSLALQPDYIGGQTVLVTGAGGSIGSEICRQLCRYRPAKVILLGRGENRIHAVYYELREHYPEIHFEPVICNITSRTAIDDVLAQHDPRVVFHAAAHKHVFLMECNPVEAVQNNVLGTAVLTEAVAAHGVERFVFISTDKATEPTSVMGATKAFCESLIAQRNAACPWTRFMAVRFGNVLGSAGSVLPIFQAQIRAGRPLTVTDPAVDRYFMSIPEAAFLVLQAGALGQGGEIYVLDMGEPIKIADIARVFLQLHGVDPDTPGAIEYIGLRAGEKLHETLVNPYEQLVETDCPQVRRAARNGHSPVWLPVEEALGLFEKAVCTCDDSAVLRVLAQATGAQIAPQPRHIHRMNARRRVPSNPVVRPAEPSSLVHG